MAMAFRGEATEQVIFQFERGTQYASARIAAFAKQHRGIRSSGYTGLCWDNAIAERFSRPDEDRIPSPTRLANEKARHPGRRMDRQL